MSLQNIDKFLKPLDFALSRAFAIRFITIPKMLVNLEHEPKILLLTFMQKSN